MKTVLVLSLSLLAIIASMSCKGTKGTGGTGQARRQEAVENRDSLLYGTWYRSYEDEGKGDGTLFTWRNSTTHKFPPSRGREGLEFLKDGKFGYLAIRPTDGIENRPGTWGWSGPKTLRLSMENGTQYVIRVESLSKEIMTGKWEQQ